MRDRTHSLILLSGTPHQGDTGKFRSLLKLVRPDLEEAIDQLEVNPDVVREVVLRNRKIDVTDADGNFIFRGHTVVRVPIELSAEMRELDRRLQSYLRRGYNAGNRLGGSTGRAIGFVMTTYRKLASSSVAAIERALRRRLERLTGAAADSVFIEELDDDDGFDDLADRNLGGSADPFFEDEPAMIRHVLDQCEKAARADAKMDVFRRLYEQLVTGDGCKLLVFSEYRATQERLIDEVRRLSGKEPAQINGGQKLSDKLAAIEAFEGDVPVLVSTEAGGEGLNLHRNCHIVINFDLPWNPARIVQRIGRVYRYGQKNHVLVLNLVSHDTIDTDIISTALARVDALSREMATVSGEFDQRYASEILGELLEQLDLSGALADAMSGEVSRSRERVEEAVERAQRAREMQDEILSTASGFDPTALARLGRFATADVRQFILRMSPYADVEATPGDERRERVSLRLPETMRGRYTEFSGRSVVEVTTNRAVAASSRSLILLDFSSAFLRDLIALSGAPEFGGGYAAALLPQRPGQFGAYLARWQSDQGELLGEELHIVRHTDGMVRADEGLVSQLLSNPIESATPPFSNDPQMRSDVLGTMESVVDQTVATGAGKHKMLNDLILLAAADGIS